MKRIGIISEPLNIQPRGVGYYTLNLINSLLKIDKNNQYRLINWTNPNKAFPAQTYITKNLLKSVSPTYGWYPTLPFQLKNSDFDIIINPSSIPTFFKFKQKYIITIHDLTPIIFPETHRAGKGFIYKYLLPKTVKEADCIVADSLSTKNDIVKYLSIPPEKISVIYPGIDSRFKVIKRRFIINAIKKKYKLPDKFILSVGTLEPRKNIVNLIKAFNLIKAKDPIYLVIVGIKGWKHQKIFETVANSRAKQRIIFTDYVDDEDLPGFYNLGLLLAYPSLYEGFGLPCLEAMACGCPVITSNISSMPEVCGSAAYYINPHSTNSIYSGLEKVLKNKMIRKRLSLEGLNQAKKFSWKKTVEEFLKIIKELSYEG